MLDKPKNKEIVELHYKHKEDKLRERIRIEKVKDEALAKKMKIQEKKAKENEIFRLAEDSLASSECSISSKDASNDLAKFDYQTNQMESNEFNVTDGGLVENSSHDKYENHIYDKSDIPCGQRRGNCVILRGFHDRMSKEPRGKSDLHRIHRLTIDNYRTHKEWMQIVTNDPKIVVSY